MPSSDPQAKEIFTLMWISRDCCRDYEDTGYLRQAKHNLGNRWGIFIVGRSWEGLLCLVPDYHISRHTELMATLDWLLSTCQGLHITLSGEASLLRGCKAWHLSCVALYLSLNVLQDCLEMEILDPSSELPSGADKIPGPRLRRQVRQVLQALELIRQDKGCNQIQSLSSFCTLRQNGWPSVHEND